MGWFVRHEVRARWRAIAALAVLVALTAGLVLATAAGARRTATAYDRFVEATATRDASVQIDDGDVDSTLSKIRDLDIVRRSGRVEIIPALPTDESLHTEVDVFLQASPDGRWGAEIDRPLVLEGRMPAPSVAGEVLLNELAARQTGLEVGDRFSVATFTPEQLRELHEGGRFTGFSGPEVDLHVVGIGRQAIDLQGADVSAGGALLVSPATHQRLAGRVGALGGMMSVELAPGASVADLHEQVKRIVGPDASFDVGGADEQFGTSTREAAEVLAKALAAFAAVSAVAAAVVVGGSIARQCAAGYGDARTLGALGFDRRQRAIAMAVAPAVGVAVGTVLAVAVAVVASSWFPVSVARRIEPDPGTRVDVAVISLGALALLVAGLGWSLLRARRLERIRVGVPRRRSWSTLALPPALSIGIAHTFDRRIDARSVPVRAALLAAVLGVVGVVASAVVVRSLDAVVDDPARYGWAWSAEPDIYTDDPAGLVEELAASRSVEAVAVRHSARLELDGLVVSALALEQQHGSIAPPLRSGRLPEAVDEVAIGQHTADELGAALGDRIPAVTADGRSTVDVEVVGIAVFAPVETTDPASGAVVTMEGLEQLRRSDGFRSILVRYAEGASPAALEASLEERELADFSVVYARPRLPGTLANLERAMPIVAALGAFFGAVAVGALAHSLVVGTRRRRRELATLLALGMRRRQVGSVVVVTALSTAAVGVLVGAPLGVAVGRATWRLVIGGHGILDAPSMPGLALAAVVPGAVLVAFVASCWPAASASHDPSRALRAE